MAKNSKKQWICCGVNVFLFILGAALVAIGLVLQLKLVPDQVNKEAKKSIIIKKDSKGKLGLNDFTHDWLHQNYTIRMQYWLFNYTNPTDMIRNGFTPSPIEKGPYSYREKQTYLYDLNNSFSSDNSQFTYTKRSEFVFDPATSCDTCHENDTFYIPDPIFFIFADLLLDIDAVCDLVYEMLASTGLITLMGYPTTPPTNLTECLKPVDGVLNLLTTVLNISITIPPNLNITLPLNLNFTLENIIPILADLVVATGGSPFLPVKAHEILFDSYKDPIFSNFIPLLLNITEPLIQTLNDTLLNGTLNMNLNLTQPPVSINQRSKVTKAYTMNTGINDYLQTGNLLQYNYTGTLSPDWWNGWECFENSTETCVSAQHLYMDDELEASPTTLRPTPPLTTTTSRATTTTTAFDYSTCHCDACKNETAAFASTIYGTTGDFFHALIKKDDKLTALVDDICRGLDFVYQKEVTVRGIKGYRFIIDPSNFDTNIPGNCGFCRQLPRDMYGRAKGSYCLPAGLLDISGCQQENAAIAISNVHFYGTAPEVSAMFPYIQSNPEDLTFIDIEPITGTVLAANKRMQINYLVKNYLDTTFANIQPGAYPLLWLNESFLYDDYTQSELNKQVFHPRHVAKLLCYIVGVGLGSLLMLIAIISTFVNFCIFKRKVDRIGYSYDLTTGRVTQPYESDLNKSYNSNGSQIPRPKRKTEDF